MPSGAPGVKDGRRVPSGGCGTIDRFGTDKGVNGMSLEGKRALILVAEGYQDEEASEPASFLREQGAEVVFAGLKPGTLPGKNGRAEVEVTHRASEVAAEDFDILVLPGGGAPERLRLDDGVLELTRAFMELPDKLVAAICHGPQVLISSRVLAGRTATCWEGIRDDVRFAGARYVDRKVVVDGRLITSRHPGDLPAFNEAMAKALAGEAGKPEPGAAVDEEADVEGAAAEAEHADADPRADS